MKKTKKKTKEGKTHYNWPFPLSLTQVAFFFFPLHFAYDGNVELNSKELRKLCGKRKVNEKEDGLDKIVSKEKRRDSSGRILQ